MDLTNTMLADDAISLEQAPAEDLSALTAGQLIERILEINASAPEEFLCGFSVDRLRNYLDHLRWAQAPREAKARERRPWHMPRETSAIGMYEAQY